MCVQCCKCKWMICMCPVHVIWLYVYRCIHDICLGNYRSIFWLHLCVCTCCACSIDACVDVIETITSMQATAHVATAVYRLLLNVSNRFESTLHSYSMITSWVDKITWQNMRFRQSQRVSITALHAKDYDFAKHKQWTIWHYCEDRGISKN